MKDRIDLNALTQRLQPVSQLLADANGPLSVEKAVDLLTDIHHCLFSIEEFRIWMKWSMGYVLSSTDFERGETDELIDQLGKRLRKEFGIPASKAVLYECQRVCRIFNNDTAAFARWLDELRASLGRPLFWSNIQNALFGGRSNPAVIGREAADRRDLRVAEDGIDALERILVRACEGDEESRGMIEGACQTVVGWALRSEQSPAVPRSDAYLGFVRRFGCAVCEAPSEAHHAFGFKALSAKSSDFATIPLCSRHHIELHRRGRKTFEDMYDLDVVEIAYNLMHRYLTGAWASLSLKLVS